MFYIRNRMLRGVYRLVDVSNGAIAQAACHRFVFLTRHFAVNLAKDAQADLELALITAERLT